MGIVIYMLALGCTDYNTMCTGCFQISSFLLILSRELSYSCFVVSYIYSVGGLILKIDSFFSYDVLYKYPSGPTSRSVITPKFEANTISFTSSGVSATVLAGSPASRTLTV
jgi:hypothetical protein